MGEIPQVSLRGARSAPKQSRAVATRLLRFARNDGIRHTVIAFLLIVSIPLFAHEGHDHGPAPAAAQLAEPPALSGRTARFEIVTRQVGDDLVVTVDGADTNAPVEAALVSVQREGKTAL